MRQVKCRDTNEICNKNEAYKAENGKYYSTEEGYLKIKYKNRIRQKCIDIVYNNLLSYPVSSYFTKRLNEYEKIGYDIVYKCLENELPQIKKSMDNIIFENDFKKICYLIACIDNKIDSYRKTKITVNHNVSIDNTDIEIKTSKQVAKDVSCFLGEI